MRRQSCVLSPPPSTMNAAAMYFLMSILSFPTVKSLELDIADQAGQFLISTLEDCLGLPTDLARMKLTLRHGDFSNNGFACQVIKTLQLGRGDWQKYAEIHIEVSKIAAVGRKELERVSPWIESITVDQLVGKSVSDHLIRFIRHTRKNLKIFINSFEIPGETAIHIPRGNISLTIGSISSSSMVLLSCDKQLACLTISESAAERLIGLRLDIDEFRVKGSPNSASLQRITAQFANVSNATTVS